MVQFITLPSAAEVAYQLVTLLVLFSFLSTFAYSKGCFFERHFFFDVFCFLVALEESIGSLCCTVFLLNEMQCSPPAFLRKKMNRTK